MELEAPLSAGSRQAGTPSPNLLRQRQRDRLTPRGRTSKEHRIATTVREVLDVKNTEVRLSPAPRAKATGRLSADMSRKRRPQDDVRQDNSAGTPGKGSRDEGKFDITPDGGSAGREGRQFTVANVGNNGRIYLRPTIRPANQRYPQPAFVFPITPPSTAGLETLAARNEEETSHRDSLWTSARSPPQTPVRLDHDIDQSRTNAYFHSRPGHRRVHSCSTVDDQHGAVHDSDYGAFKIVIERPGTGRPKTAEESGAIPTLEVSIPSYRLGTPRFSVRGTPFIRGSSYAGTDDMRDSVLSRSQLDVSVVDRDTLHPNIAVSRRHSHTSPQQHYIRPASESIFPHSLPSPTHTHRMPICPEMFDVLTFRPACDDPSVVRYSSTKNFDTRTITAATPPRLVAEITAITDYELLADFFLTFRSFISTPDLTAMLIARFRWALAREDEIGTVVRVRTFVALRHWILNYFVDDFALDFYVRLTFCELFNAFYDDVVVKPKVGKDRWLKELGDLKICWRRNCSLYWDSPVEDSPTFDPGVAITPGGIPGSREPQLTPTFWRRTQDDLPQLDEFLGQENTAAGHNFFADVSRAGHVETTFYRPQTPPEQTVNQMMVREGHSSPGSVMSDDVLSCSFPTKSRIAQLGSHNPLGAHPVATSSRYDSSQPVAHLPRMTGKSGRPTHSHKRSGSFSDSLRDYRGESVDKVLYKGTELVMVAPNTGNLLRGILFPPSSAFVEVIVPRTPVGVRGTTYFTSADATNHKEPSAMSAPGMKKLLGSVRRALSNRAGPSSAPSPVTGGFPQIGAKGVVVNRLPGTSIVPHPRVRSTGARAQMRIDMLAATILEDFNKAIRESAEADRKEQDQRASLLTIGKASGNEKMYPSMQLDDTHDDPDRSWLAPGRTAVSALTNGSKSIVIFDDTLPMGIPAMSGALPVNPSTDSFADDAFMHPSGGPTPPATPPEQTVGSPRRSSHLLGANVNNHHRSLSLDRTPPLVNDNNSPSEVYRSPSFREVRHPSIRSYGKSFRSGKSISLRRYASYHSGFTRHQTERSFDATTFSGSMNPPSEPQAPAPLRVLRRRPGGDLRAATNVGELDFEPRRPRSTGSLTTYSDSVHSSYLFGQNLNADVDVSNYNSISQERTRTFSLGALAETAPKRGVSLFSTHSSQPVMRPSFEAEAAKLAQIPDDADDDGGVESALLKLEGKYEHRKSDMSSSSYLNVASSLLPAPMDELAEDIIVDDEKLKRRHKQINEANISKTPPLLDTYRPEPLKHAEKTLKPAVYQPRKPDDPAQALTSRDSEESYSSIPLLQRDSHPKANHRKSRNWSEISVLRGSSQDRGEYGSQSPHTSIDIIHETESLKRIPVGETLPRVAGGDESFLDDDSDDDSALSSEMSIEVILPTDYSGSGLHVTSSQAKGGPFITQDSLPSHALRHPSSPPMSMAQALSMSPEEQAQVPQLQMNQLPTNNLPPTPDVTPTLTGPAHGFGKRSWEKSDESGPLRTSDKPGEVSQKFSVHLPFIFAFDSKALAQQFTLIEKECLNEIDWKELIEMRWKNNSPTSRSWVNFLRNEGARGVDVVIARFNIMVNWAVSEIVLTQALEERVQTMIKYIHIAKHCREYRNYATMYQLTMALTSNIISKLTKTWRHVPAVDMATLKELEALIQPTLNFNSLRAEMESAGGDQGCIPFVGIYTHDLLFNSQRPSQIASTPTTEPLVNFERCRTSAAIVKNLLRLLEASQLYRFQEVEGITERCLWMAALSDVDIKKYAEAIE